MATPFLGEIRLFAGNFAPLGWTFCSGQLLPIAENDALYAVIGTTYGGDGVTTFAVPDLRGRFAVHMGTGPGLAPVVQGQLLGSGQVTLTSSTMPQHTHTFLASSGGPTTHSPSGAAPATLPRSMPAVYGAAPGNVNLNPNAVLPVGGSVPFDNYQPYLGISFIIALEGIFPSRN